MQPTVIPYHITEEEEQTITENRTLFHGVALILGESNSSSSGTVTLKDTEDNLLCRLRIDGDKSKTHTFFANRPIRADGLKVELSESDTEAFVYYG